MKRFRYQGRAVSRYGKAVIMDDARFCRNSCWHFVYDAFSFDEFLSIFKVFLASK